MSESLSLGTKIDHDLYGIGIIGDIGLTSYDVYFEKNGKTVVSKSSNEFTVVSTPETTGEEQSNPVVHLDVKEFEEMFTTILDKYAPLPELVEIADKWTGGKIMILPGNESLQAKEVPIDTFFHKIVMVRDRLRVMEQNINSHPSLKDEEKVNLQQYITRIYGSLTTFNVLFKNKDDFFSGSAS
jgi:hypothetical protein